MIYFVRHGQTEWNVQKVSQGWSDNPLNEIGRAQAEKVADEIVKLRPTYFFCSDLMRARETAEIINKKLNMEIIFDSRLREFGSGRLEGQKKHELPLDIMQDFKKNPHKYGAESLEDVFKRAQSFIKEIVDRKLENVLVVSHGGFIVMMRYCELNKEWNEEKSAAFRDMHINNTQIMGMDFKLYKK
jgi:probable phosphoglycerate mutase